MTQDNNGWKHRRFGNLVIIRAMHVVILCLMATAINGNFSRAKGDLIISVEAKTFAPQSNDSFNVYIESNVNQNLWFASYMFEIAPQAGNTASLFFRNSFDITDLVNTTRQSNSEQSLANYVFAGDLNMANFRSARQPDPLKIIGRDLSNSGLGVTLAKDQKYLLTQLEVFTQNPGDGSFRISLVKDPAQTIFQDVNGVDVTISEASFSSVPFQITAVPEPSSTVLGLGALISFLLTRSKRAKQYLSRLKTVGCSRSTRRLGRLRPWLGN